MTAVFVFILRIVVALCLYFFLGYVIYTLWQELRLTSQFNQRKRIPPITVTRDGVEPVSFSGAEVLLGREASNTYTIPDDTVSGRHARLNYHHNQWWIEDLNSTNGTFLNNERIFTPTIIVNGDQLRLGKVQAEIMIAETTGDE